MTVHDAATQEGIMYVASMESALAAQHKQLCDPSNGHHPGINNVKIDSATALKGLARARFGAFAWIHNSLHPNEIGHAAMHSAFDGWLRDADLVPSTASDLASQEAPQATPPCSFTDETNHSCSRRRENENCNSWAILGPGSSLC